jgi:hypothetical protein
MQMASLQGLLEKKKKKKLKKKKTKNKWVIAGYFDDGNKVLRENRVGLWRGLMSRVCGFYVAPSVAGHWTVGHYNPESVSST